MKQILTAAALALSVALPSAASAADKSFEGVDIRVLTTKQPWEDAIGQLKQTFEEQTGANVQVDTYAFGQAVQKIAVELSTQSPTYDLVFLEASDIPRWAVGGRIAPLDDYVAADAGFDIGDFIKTTIDGHSYDGKLYGIPYFAATQIMYYQGPVLQDAGYDAPPKTFSEMLDMCAKLQTSEMACTAMRGKPGTSENIWYWTQIMLGEGGNWVADYPSDMTPTVNSPAAVKALEIYKTLVTEYGVTGSVSAGYDDVVIALQQAKVAMAIEGAPLAGRIVDPAISKVNGKLGFAVPPGGPAGTFAPYTSQGWSINAASRNKDAAAAFLLWATSAETMKKVTEVGSFLAVTRTSIWDDPEFQKAKGFDFGYGSFTKAYQDTLDVSYPNYRLPIPEFREMGDRVGQALQEAVIGSKTPQEALDDAQADIEKLFKRAGYLK